MRLLLDTHCWLWMLASPERFATRVRGWVEDAGNELLLSAASSWEIAIKHRAGRLELPEPPATFVPDRIRSTGVIPLAIEHSHALRVAELPPIHRDPFDRMLVAQAQLEDVPILTVDEKLGGYDVQILWADRD